MAFAMQGLDDPRFLVGGELREYRGRFGALGQLLVREGIDLVAQQDVLGRQANLAAHVSGYRVVVAGQNLDRDPVLLQRGDGRRGAVLGRVQEGDVANQHQVGFIRDRVGSPTCGNLFVRDRDDPETVLVEFTRYRS